MCQTQFVNKPIHGEPPIDDGLPLPEVIAGHPFLQGMKAQHLALLSQNARLVSFKDREWIFREDEPANRFYLIRSGQVALEANVPDRGRLLIETIGPGDVVGWSWLFPPYYWRFDARAVGPVEAIFFYGTQLRTDCESDREFGFQLLQRMAKVVVDRLQAERGRLVRLAERGLIDTKTG